MRIEVKSIRFIKIFPYLHELQFQQRYISFPLKYNLKTVYRRIQDIPNNDFFILRF